LTHPVGNSHSGPVGAPAGALRPGLASQTPKAAGNRYLGPSPPRNLPHHITQTPATHPALFQKLFERFTTIELIQVDDEVETLLWQLHENHTLASMMPRLRYINGFSMILGQPKNKEKELDIRTVARNLWKVAGCFKLATVNEIGFEPYWYMMDELGCSVRHSDMPNVMICPLLYSPSNNLLTDALSISVSSQLAIA
jgi:hypothetical protein